MVWSSSLTRGVVGVVEGRGHRCWLLSTRDVLTLTRVVEVVVVVCGGAGTGPEGGWQSRMLTRHASTEHVTYPLMMLTVRCAPKTHTNDRSEVTDSLSSF